MTQKELVLNYLKSGRRLTVLKALNLFNCMSLSQRIGNLKSEGYPVKGEMIRTKTGKYISEYHYQK
jgi:hypothetical protein